MIKFTHHSSFGIIPVVHNTNLRSAATLFRHPTPTSTATTTHSSPKPPSTTDLLKQKNVTCSVYDCTVNDVELHLHPFDVVWLKM